MQNQTETNQIFSTPTKSKTPSTFKRSA